VRAQWTATSRLRLHSGVRYEYNSLFGPITAPEFGASFTVAPGYAFSTDIARGFRNPTIRELYMFPARIQRSCQSMSGIIRRPSRRIR